MDTLVKLVLTLGLLASTATAAYHRKTFKDYCSSVDGDSEHYMCKDFVFNTFDHIELNIHDQSISTADLVQFQNCTMRKFPKIFFKKFHWVVYLHINNCKLRNITNPDKDADNLENLERIVEMNYRRNQIETLPNYYFHYFSNLAKLDLSYNAIKEISSSIFEYAVGLKMLYLEGNSISELAPDAFKNILNLTSIVLSENKIKALPATIFKYNTKLSLIDLNDNEITFLPVDVFNGLTNLEFLRLDKNDFNTQTFTPALLNLPMLTHLNLSNTELKINDEMFSKCSNLEFVDLSRNNLKKIDVHIFKGLKNLLQLHINDNDLSEFDFKNEIFKKENFELQVYENQWKCPYLRDMMIYFDGKKIEHRPPQDRFVDILDYSCLRGIKCYGEFNYDKYSDFIEGDVSAELAEHISGQVGTFIATIIFLTIFAVIAIAVIVVLVLQPDFIMGRFRRTQSAYRGNSFENNSEILSGDQFVAP
ncbi:hypothetical protein ACFFRR_002801 [Megaselia abdita]